MLDLTILIGEICEIIEESWHRDIVNWNAIIARYLQLSWLTPYHLFWEEKNRKKKKKDNSDLFDILKILQNWVVLSFYVIKLLTGGWLQYG